MTKVSESLVGLDKLHKHYKGGFYTPLYLSTHTETEEQLVVYRDEESGRIFCRPVYMWLESVKLSSGKSVPRFQQAQDVDSSEIVALIDWCSDQQSKTCDGSHSSMLLEEFSRKLRGLLFDDS